VRHVEVREVGVRHVWEVWDVREVGVWHMWEVREVGVRHVRQVRHVHVREVRHVHVREVETREFVLQRSALLVEGGPGRRVVIFHRGQDRVQHADDPPAHKDDKEDRVFRVDAFKDESHSDNEQVNHVHALAKELPPHRKDFEKDMRSEDV